MDGDSGVKTRSSRRGAEVGYCSCHVAGIEASSKLPFLSWAFGLMIRQVLVGVVAALVAVTSVRAQSSLGGAGVSLKCGDWTGARRVEQKDVGARARVNMVTSWAQGYLSAINTKALGDTGQIVFVMPNSDILEAMLDRQCKKDPLVTMFEATMEVETSLRVRMIETGGV